MIVLDSKRLPKELKRVADELVEALRRPLHAEWPPETDYVEAAQPAAIAEALIPVLHDHLVNERIAFVFKQKMKEPKEGSPGKVQLAHAKKLNTLYVFLSHAHWVIQFNWKRWRELGPEQRIALVDHELCHLEVETNDQGDTVRRNRRHDVEEFIEVVQRWGTWKSDLVLFRDAIQTELALVP